MNISRHAVDDLEHMATVFRRRLGDLEKHLDWVRTSPSELYSFFLDAADVYLAGSIIAPDLPEVARALRLAAQGGTALFVFQRLEDSPRPFIIGEGPPVTYTEPAGPGCADYITWKLVFYVSLITRESQLTDELCHVPNEVFRHADLVGAATADYHFPDLLRAVWTQERFTDQPAFRQEEACHQQNLHKPDWAQHVRCLGRPFLQVLRQLEQRDDSRFASVLGEALQGHKEYWSSEKYREEFSGFVSLPLTAVAALAWERGMRFDVESDYMPASWVRGDLFRMP